MKKLFASLFLAMLGYGLVAVAGLHPVYDLTLDGVSPNGVIPGVVDGLHENAFPILETTNRVQDGYIVYKPSETMTMNYTVLETENRNLSWYHDLHNLDPDTYEDGATYHNVAKVYFTTNQTTYLGIWSDIDGKASNEAHHTLKLDVVDYGIYFLDQDDENGKHTLLSTLNQGVEVTADRAFGVYYTDGITGNTYTTTNNWVASYDTPGTNNHLLEEGKWFTDGEKARTTTGGFCLFQGDHGDWPTKLEWEHVEFGFVTGEVPSGQPLPGTLATIIISGLCATTLRKRNKKA